MNSELDIGLKVLEEFRDQANENGYVHNNYNNFKEEQWIEHFFFKLAIIGYILKTREKFVLISKNVIRYKI